MIKLRNGSTKLLITTDFLPKHTPLKVIITSGASCPDSVIEGVINKLNSFYTNLHSIEQVFKNLI